MARVPSLSFTKSWQNREDFPTYEDNEDQVRADLQCLFDELRDYLNQKLLPAVNSISAVEVTAASGGTVQGALNQLRSDLNAAVMGSVPDGSITAAKLAADARLMDVTAQAHLAPDPGFMENRPEERLRFWYAPALKLLFVQGTVTLQRAGNLGFHVRYHYNQYLPQDRFCAFAAQANAGDAVIYTDYSLADDGVMDLRVQNVPDSASAVTAAVSGWYFCEGA